MRTQGLNLVVTLIIMQNKVSQEVYRLRVGEKNQKVFNLIQKRIVLPQLHLKMKRGRAKIHCYGNWFHDTEVNN